MRAGLGVFSVPLLLFASALLACDSSPDQAAPEAVAVVEATVTGAAPTRELPFRPNVPFLQALPVGYRVEVVLDGLEFPTSVAATPDGRLLIAEQETGRVRVVQDGVLLPQPWAEIPVYVADAFVGELGLVSIAADPQFADNGFVYVYYTEGAGAGRRTVLARLREIDGRGGELTELFSLNLAPERRHIAGGIAFDATGAVLVGVGDHEDASLSPRLDTPAGKVLRIDRDGNAPPDNPLAGRDGVDARIYASGLRNPYGVAVDPASGRAYITENRNVAGDAVYELVAGADFGWPDEEVVSREPLVLYDVPMGAAGITVYRGDGLPAFDGDVFFCTFHHGGALHWSEPEPLAGFELAQRDRIIVPGCTSGLTVGADGFLYFLSYGEGKLMRISR